MSIELAPPNKALNAIRTNADEDAPSIVSRSDLHQRVVTALKRQPDIPWDFTVADMAQGALNGLGGP